MFDRDNTGTINVNEFCELWKYLGQWRQTFDRYDVDRSGNISQQELASALQQMGYRLAQCGTISWTCVIVHAIFVSIHSLVPDFFHLNQLTFLSFSGCV